MYKILPFKNHSFSGLKILVAGLAAWFAVPLTSMAQAPVISYPSPQTYTLNSAITPLIPANSGASVTAPGYGAPTVFSTITPSPIAVTGDNSGNIYISNGSFPEVDEYSSSGSMIEASFNQNVKLLYLAASQLALPVVAADANGRVERLNTNLNPQRILGTGYTGVVGLAVDKANDVFFATATTVYEVPFQTSYGAVITLVGGFSHISGITVDGTGNIYLSDDVAGNIVKLQAGTYLPTTLNIGLSTPTALSCDGLGNLFVIDNNTHGVYEIPDGGSGALTMLSTAFTTPVSIFVDRNNRVFVADEASQVYVMTPQGGFYISPQLPQGLVLDPVTGIISGTPTAVSAAASYTVTAYAGSLSGTANLTISTQALTNTQVPPAISYSVAPNYPTGVTIANITPQNTGGPVAVSGWNAGTAFGPGFVQHLGIAVDNQYNVYICDAATGPTQGVTEIPADGSATIQYGNGVNARAVAVDTSGNIYIIQSGALFHATRGNSTVSPYGPSLSNLSDVSVDPHGNVYVLDSAAQHIYQISTDGSSATSLASAADGMINATSIAVDASGNLVEGDMGDHTLKLLIPSRGGFVTITPNLNPVHLVYDLFGTIYEADASGAINQIFPGGASVNPTGVAGGCGVAIDGKGLLYSCNRGSGQILKAVPSGAFFIDKLLPAGINMSNFTGVISGGTNVATPTTSYTVTAYNSFGSSSATFAFATAAPPSISYTSPQTYIAGTLISPLSPLSTGTAVGAPAYYTSPVLVAGGYNNPQGIARDSINNYYIAEKANHRVVKIAASGTSLGFIVGFTSPVGVAIDKTGNIYVADAASPVIKEIPANGGAEISIGSGFTAPSGIAVDAGGNLYVADGATLYKITSGGVQTQLMAGFNSLSGVAVSPDGKLVYVADSGAGKVYQITAASSPAYLLSVGGSFNSPSAIVLDNSGNLFVSDATHQVFEIRKAQTTQAVSLGLSLPVSSTPTGLAVDGNGNLFFSDAATGQFDKVAPLGGYYPFTPLPEGLSIDNTTGIISGTPKSVAAAAYYYVTAYAGGVPGVGVVNITVTANQSAPVLKYSVSPNYAPGSSITPLLPFNTGGPVDPTISYNSTPTVFGTGVTPFGRIVYGYNNTIFVADKLDASVAQIFSDGSANRLASFLYQPNGIAVDNIGGIWIADNQNVREINYGGGSTAFIVAGGSFQIPTSIAADFHGHIFVGDLGLAGVYRMQNDGTNIVKIDNGITHPDALASDAAGNVYAVSSTANALYKIPADGSAQVTVATFTQPTDVALDPDGNIAVATNDGHIYMILASGGAPFLVRQSIFANISGLTFDANGTLYVGQSTSPGVSQLNLTGSYKAVSLPAGISINRTTGVITGSAPSNPFPGQFIFNVSGYNLYGSSTYTVFINTTSGPSFSYSSPTSFYKGVAATLSPQNGGSVYPLAYYDNNLTEIASGFNNPRGVAIDTAGNVYVADQGNNVVKKILPGSSTPVCVGTGFNSAAGLAIDNAGNIYVADSGNGLVKEIPAGGGQIQIIASGFTSLQALAIDQAGNLYAGDDGNKAIYKIATGTRTKSLVINTGFSVGIASIAVDANGTLYTADSNPNVLPLIYKLPAGSGSLTPLTSIESVISPGGFLVDPLGNFFFLEAAGVQIFELRPGDEFYTDVATGWAGNAGGMALDGTGSFMIASGNKLYKLSPSGGFYVNKALPKGLNFDQTSGNISGTPLAVSPATNYTITGYHDNVAGAAALNLSVAIPSADPALADLAVDGNTIAPAFDASTLSYNAMVDWSVTSATVTPTLNNAGATVTVNGQPVSSGTSSQSLPLAYGNNTVTVKVTAQDAVTTRTYAITINRQLAPENITFNTLPSATYGDADITPGATSDNSSVAITYSSDNHSVATIVNGNIHIVGAGTANITALQAGDATHNSATSVVQQLTVNPAGLTVTADNQTATYGGSIPTLTASYSGFVNGDGAANLTMPPTLSTTGTSSSPVGVYAITAGSAVDGNYNIRYTAGTLTIGQAGLTISADSKSMIAGQQVPALTASYAGFVNGDGSGNLTAQPQLSTTATSSSAPGQYTISAGGATATNYNISYVNGLLTINGSSDASLSGISLSKGQLSPAFSASTTTYTLNVANNITAITLTPATNNASATIKVNGIAVTSGTASGAIALAEGAQTVITTVVTAQDGTSTKTYTLTVTRAPSSEAYLAIMSVKTATLSPAFAYNTYSYTSNVANSVSSVMVTPSLIDTNGTIKVNGAIVKNKKTSDPITLAVGPNTINIVVTAQNGTSTKTYTLTVIRAPSPEAYLAIVTINMPIKRATLSPAFAYNTYSYASDVANSVSSVTVTPTLIDTAGTIKVNGTTVKNKKPSDPITLAVGQNTINVVVTAQDGTTTKTYKFTVTRAGSSEAYLAFMNIKTAALSPAFAYNTYSYTSNVANSVGSVTVTPSLIDTTGTIKVDGTGVGNKKTSGAITLAVGQTTINVVVTAQDGASTHTYSVIIARAPSGADSYDRGISVTKPTETPQMADDGIQVHQGVSPNGDGINDFLQIDNISQYPDNKLMIMNRNGQLIYEASGYDNSSKIFDGHNNKNGQMQLPGTYFYQLDYTIKGITKHKTGFIVLKY